MQFLVIFVLSLLCVHAYRMPFLMDSVSSTSSEEMMLYPSGGNRQPMLPKMNTIYSASREEIPLYPSGAYRKPILPIMKPVSSESSEEILLYPSDANKQMMLPIIDSVSSTSSEEMMFYPSGSAVIKPQLTVAHLGVVSEPGLQVVTVPRYANDLTSKRLLAQALAPQDVDEPYFGGLSNKGNGATQLLGGYGDLSPSNMPLNFGSRGGMVDGGVQPELTKGSNVDEELQPVLELLGGQMPNNVDYNKYEVW